MLAFAQIVEQKTLLEAIVVVYKERATYVHETTFRGYNEDVHRY